MPFACPEQTAAIPAARARTDPADGQGSSTAIGGFQEGPGLVDVATPIIQFLRRWLPRPLTRWQQELAGEAWPAWQVDLLTRTVTFLWFLAGSIAMSLCAIGIIALLWKLIGL